MVERIVTFDLSQYNEKFFEWHVEHAHAYSRFLGRSLPLSFGIRSIVDFGCGIGSFIEGALFEGCERVKGVDIAAEVARMYASSHVRDLIHTVDVTQPMEIETFECAVSFETAEHIDPEGTQQFLDNLCASAEKYILFTAAPPERGSNNPTHINSRPMDFWVQEIEARGFTHSRMFTSDLRLVWGLSPHLVPTYMTQDLRAFVAHGTEVPELRG